MADILFVDLLETLNILEEDLSPYKGTNLSGFNGSKTKPLGYIELMVTYREEPPGISRTVKTTFLVLPCKSIYNCIISRPTLGRLGEVASMVNLKIKSYSSNNEVITLDTDLALAKHCHLVSLKSEEEYVGANSLTTKSGSGKTTRSGLPKSESLGSQFIPKHGTLQIRMYFHSSQRYNLNFNI